MAALPEKLKKNDYIRSTIFRRFNALIEYLRASEIRGDNKTIAVNRTPGGTIIRSLVRPANERIASAGFEYNGPFAVKFKTGDSGTDRSRITVNAGYLLCNGRYFDCEFAELFARAGIVCVHAEFDGSDGDGAVRITTPGISIEEKPDATHWPIAEIVEDDETEELAIRQYCSPVAVFLFTAPCPIATDLKGESNE